MNMYLCFLIIPFLLIFVASSDFEIPNRYSVPGYCVSSLNVLDPFHINPYGGGPYNVFGEDYNKQNSWSALCRLDSDNDGLTNGQELGDPNCTFGQRSHAFTTSQLSNPALCTSSDNQSCSTGPTCSDIASVCFSTLDKAVLGVSTLLILIVTVMKLVIHPGLVHKLETGSAKVGGTSLPYHQPGFSWDR